MACLSVSAVETEDRTWGCDIETSVPPLRRCKAVGFDWMKGILTATETPARTAREKACINFIMAEGERNDFGESQCKYAEGVRAALYKGSLWW